MLEDAERIYEFTELRYSIGAILAEGGAVRDVIPGRAAANAGIAPGARIAAVNGRRYSPAVLRQAIQAAKESPEPIELIVEDTGYYKTYHVDYHEGERYPKLERDSSRSDLLAEILKPRSR
jgi:C-terminal processing protease CtpA/Prc